MHLQSCNFQLPAVVLKKTQNPESRIYKLEENKPKMMIHKHLISFMVTGTKQIIIIEVVVYIKMHKFI